MNELAFWLTVAFGVVAVLAAVITVIGILTYKKLTISFTSLRVYPEFKVNRNSLLGALVGVVTRNFVSAAAGFIKGVKVEGKINVFNPGNVPLYIPASEHEVLIEGRPSPQVIRLGAFWLKPGGTRVLPVCVNLSKEHIPQVALKVLTRGGKVNIEIRSRATLGPLSYKRTTRISPGVSRSNSQPPRARLPATTRPA